MERIGTQCRMEAPGRVRGMALAGTAIGGLTSVVASWLTQRA
jgi:hypothetical protein